MVKYMESNMVQILVLWMEKMTPYLLPIIIRSVARLQNIYQYSTCLTVICRHSTILNAIQRYAPKAKYSLKLTTTCRYLLL